MGVILLKYYYLFVIKNLNMTSDISNIIKIISIIMYISYFSKGGLKFSDKNNCKSKVKIIYIASILYVYKNITKMVK